MDCPICQLSMTETQYEDEDILMCETCWGYWLSRDKLNRIIKKIKYKFSEEEKSNIISSLHIKEKSENIKQCPSCSNTMEQKLYDKDVPIKIDECLKHGIWLDPREIKALQVFLEKKFND